jgi:hypothetical protein
LEVKEDPRREVGLTENNKEELYCSRSKVGSRKKDKHKIYFPESQVGPARKVTGQISINKSDTFLIWHTLSLIYSTSLVERVAAAERKKGNMEGLSLLVLVMCWWRPTTLALWLE